MRRINDSLPLVRVYSIAQQVSVRSALPVAAGTTCLQSPLEPCLHSFTLPAAGFCRQVPARLGGRGASGSGPCRHRQISGFDAGCIELHVRSLCPSLRALLGEACHSVPAGEPSDSPLSFFRHAADLPGLHRNPRDQQGEQRVGD